MLPDRRRTEVNSAVGKTAEEASDSKPSCARNGASECQRWLRWEKCCIGEENDGRFLPSPPAPDRGGADAKEAGGLGLAEAGVDGPQQPLAEVDRVLLHRPQSRSRSSFPQPALARRSRTYTSRTVNRPGALFSPAINVLRELFGLFGR